MTRNKTEALPALSSVIPPEDIIRCSCGSAAFFDWGMQLVHTSPLKNLPKLKDYQDRDSLRICVGCQTPVMLYGGILYDASEFVSADEVSELIGWSQQRTTRVPARAMDP